VRVDNGVGGVDFQMNHGTPHRSIVGMFARSIYVRSQNSHPGTTRSYARDSTRNNGSSALVACTCSSLFPLPFCLFCARSMAGACDQSPELPGLSHTPLPARLATSRSVGGQPVVVTVGVVTAYRTRLNAHFHPKASRGFLATTVRQTLRPSP
jgi:hypothetical protein